MNDPAYDDRLKELLSFSVPLIGVEELQNIQNEVFIFDTRKTEEYHASHIEGAVLLGYEPIRWEMLDAVPKDSTLILYCSVGYRSELVGEALRKRGFKDVRNLYGGLFSWVNQGQPVVNANGEPTRKVHTYNAAWGQWLLAPGTEKVW